MLGRTKDVRQQHSLKVAARAVMAAQRFAEAPLELDDGASMMTSNMHRSETTVPFSALIHFLTFSTELELSKPWQMKKPMVSTGTGFYIGNRRILTNSHVIRDSTSLRVERHGQVRAAFFFIINTRRRRGGSRSASAHAGCLARELLARLIAVLARPPSAPTRPRAARTPRSRATSRRACSARA